MPRRCALSCRTLHARRDLSSNIQLGSSHDGPLKFGCLLTDALRMAVADALCRSAERRGQFKEAMFELETEDTLGGCASVFQLR